MCDQGEYSQADAHLSVPRRGFLKVAGSSLVGLTCVPEGGSAEPTDSPKPQNVVSPDAALELLRQGNDRYVRGVMRLHDFQHEREALVQGQNPYAGVLSCADSRIAPEYAFDAGRGDLFVVRVAGNFANADGIASFEYAAHFLGTPLLMVLGHKKCGAVEATIKSVKDNASLPGHIPSLATAISPAVTRALHEPGDLTENAIKQNVMLNVEKLKTATPILSRLVEERKLKVVGGIYDLGTGRVDLLA